MRIQFILLVLSLVVGGCATQGQKTADIEDRTLSEQQAAQSKQQDEAQKQQEADRQAKIAKEKEESSRLLEEQRRRQADQPIVKPLPDGGVGESQLKGDAWAQLKQTGSPLSQRSIYFDYDRYDIKEEFVPIVGAHAKFLEDNAAVRVTIQGNCDDRGSREYNLALGQRRADGVKRAMVLLGVRDKQIESVSFGAEKPVALGQDEESWAKNRRSDIVYPGEPK
ncbi:MAG: peptidoglycan-associated lipoprotein Pal [Burkholderiales bacterium]